MITPPRPILKTRPNSSNLNEYFPSPSNALPFEFPTSPHVHFPPSPTLTDFQTTHSPFVYDRAPIVVLPNVCKLPERGGRNYSAYGIMTTPPNAYSQRRRSGFDRNIHPKHEDMDENPPPLVPDHSSESEDSDASSMSSPAHADEFDSMPSTSEDITTMYSGITPMASPRTLAFLPRPHDSEHQVCPLRRPKPKRKQTGPRARTPTLRGVKDMFVGGDSELSLDGCLGGF